jgi:histidinol dehydrogenase
MKIYKYPSNEAEDKLQFIIKRGIGFTEQEFANVVEILKDVKENGDDAIVKYTKQFDSELIDKNSLIATDNEIKEAGESIDKNFIHSLEIAIKNIKNFHKFQIEKSWIKTNDSGVILGQIVNPVDNAGIYAPGGKSGKTPLVSSVLMGAIPAKLAGVKNIMLATPPCKDGSINPHILIAAKMTGVNTIYKIGGAWAIAAMAYGTKTVKKADVICGPGNVYVTIAKKIASETTGVDMIAGPSEVLVIADDHANPQFAAADLLSQAEHDTRASSILITDSENFALKTKNALKTQLEKLDRSEIAKKSLDAFGAIIIVNNIDTAIELSNMIAPEHLELLIKEPFEYIGKIKNAGAVFIGEYSPEPVGDYIAGPNHVLPTAGAARFSSALSVQNFTKKTSIINYSKKAFYENADHIMKLAKIEGLGGHAASIEVRLNLLIHS